MAIAFRFRYPGPGTILGTKSRISGDLNVPECTPPVPRKALKVGQKSNKIGGLVNFDLSL